MSTEKLGVVGAGMMGSEIALVFAMAGKPVLLADTSEEGLNAAVKKLSEVLDSGIARGFWAEEDKPLALSRITTTTNLEDFSDREMVIEAVFEDVAIKSEVFAKLDKILSSACIIASNTSSISITVLSANLSDDRQADFLGLHFFSPVHRMKFCLLYTSPSPRDS